MISCFTQSWKHFNKISLLARHEQSGPGGTGTKLSFLTGTATKMFFLTRSSTQIFSEQGRDQNVFFGPGPWSKGFRLGTGTEICFWRDRDEIFFLTGTGIKNDWSRSCLLLAQKLIRKFSTDWIWQTLAKCKYISLKLPELVTNTNKGKTKVSYFRCEYQVRISETFSGSMKSTIRILQTLRLVQVKNAVSRNPCGIKMGNTK
jgi:hypothetical protein